MWKTKVHAVGKELEPPPDGDWIPVAFVPKDGTSMVVVWEHDPEAYGLRDRSEAWDELCEALPKDKVFVGDGRGVDKVIGYIKSLMAQVEAHHAISNDPEARLWVKNTDTGKNEPLVREELLKEAKRALRRSEFHADEWSRQCNMASENHVNALNTVTAYRKALHQCSRVLAKWVRSERIACDTIVKIGKEHKEVLEQLKRANSTIMQTPSMAVMQQKDKAFEDERARANQYLASLKVKDEQLDKQRKMYTECCKYAQGWRKRADGWFKELIQVEAKCTTLREEAEQLRRKYVYVTPAQWDARMPKTIWAKRQPIENDPGHIACSDTPCPDGSSLPYVLGNMTEHECQECHGDGCARDSEGTAIPDKPCRSCDGEET